MIAIREARPTDCEACATIHILARQAMANLPRDLHGEAETRAWKREVVFATQDVIVAEADGGEIVGYLALDGDWVTNLYVRPGEQGRGTGKALLDTAKARSPDGLRLWVFQPNAGAIRFYARHGFRTVRKTDGRDNEEKVPDRLMAWPG